jgi:hypothetical protein
VVILLWSFGANTQLFNPVVTAPFTGVFGPPGTLPIPFYNQTAAVNYNYGGQGVGYKVPSPACVGVTCVAGASTYRADAVNFKATTFSGFTFLLAFNASPNAYNYTISISQPGPYVITLWGGSGSTGGSWNILIDNQVVGNVQTLYDPVHGYDTMAPSTSASFNATLGTHILTLAWGSGDVNGSPGDIVAWQGQQAVQNITSNCDIGPSYSGQIPAPATQAGFTHCAFNYDFTQTASFTDAAGTHQWSNLSSWFVCDKNNTSNPYLFRYSGDVGCQDGVHQLITNDGGVQVLAMSYLLTDAQSGKYSNLLLHQSSSSSQPIDPIPEEYYIEVVLRPSATHCGNSPGCIYFSHNTFTFVQGNPCFVATDQEWDNDATTTGVGFAPWNLPSCNGTSSYPNGVCCASPVGGTINTSYDTWGIMVTADGVNQFSGCDYWKAGAVSGLTADSFLSCFQYNPINAGATTAVFNTPLHWSMTEGPQSSGQGGSSWTLGQHTTYIQRATIWECSGYQTGPCITNPVVTGHP